MKSLMLLLCLPFFTGCSSKITTLRTSASSPGKFIVLVGISGSGKSSIAKELGHALNANVFLEPEENEWPDIVKNSGEYGEFSAMMAFRNFRIKNLFEAKKLRDQGKTVIVDSYYDKITSYYVDKPGMEWLISPRDPYFAVAKEVTALDTKHLPDADCLILFDIDFKTWQKFLNSRNRARDHISGFQESYSQYKSYIENAAVKLSSERSIKIIRFKQSFSDPKTQSKHLIEVLKAEGII